MSFFIIVKLNEPLGECIAGLQGRAGLMTVSEGKTKRGLHPTGVLELDTPPDAPFDIVHDENDGHWLLSEAGAPVLARTLETIAEVAPGGFCFEAVWAGDKTLASYTVTLDELLTIIRSKRLPQATRYCVNPTGTIFTKESLETSIFRLSESDRIRWWLALTFWWLVLSVGVSLLGIFAYVLVHTESSQKSTILIIPLYPILLAGLYLLPMLRGGMLEITLDIQTSQVTFRTLTRQWSTLLEDITALEVKGDYLHIRTAKCTVARVPMRMQNLSLFVHQIRRKQQKVALRGWH